MGAGAPGARERTNLVVADEVDVGREGGKHSELRGNPAEEGRTRGNLGYRPWLTGAPLFFDRNGHKIRVLRRHEADPQARIGRRKGLPFRVDPQPTLEREAVAVAGIENGDELPHVAR